MRMDIRYITPDYAVSPQIDPSDVASLKSAGFHAVICNRPDAEIPPSHHAAVIKELVEAEGMTFHELPVVHGSLTMDLVQAQADILKNANGPVFAYCASGNRCSIVWSLGQAGVLSTDEIIASTTKAGYQLDHLRGQLDAMANG